MAEATTQFSTGAPVEIDQIDRELKKLWADGENAMTRASLINLAVYSEEPGSLARNTQLISQITESHACRALVIETNPRAEKDWAEAWLNAHCHVRGNSKQICSEQISFRLGRTKLLTSILFSHLDSDLPLYLWWQSQLREPLDPQLWAWVDRLIYDSCDWRDFGAQMNLVETAKAEAEPRQMVLCDLNWARLLHFRLAFAQFFDHPASHRNFDKIENVSLTFGSGYRSTALLLIGWIASQLEWKVTQGNGGFELKNLAGKSIGVELSEDGPDFSLVSLTVQTLEVEFCIHRAKCGDLLEVCRGKPGEKHAHQLLPADDGELATLVSEELMRGGDRSVYERTIEKVRGLL